MIMMSGLVCGVQFVAVVRLRAGMPSPTGPGVRVRRSIWASLSSAPARLILLLVAFGRPGSRRAQIVVFWCPDCRASGWVTDS
jgi:hypothetical protein